MCVYLGPRYVELFLASFFNSSLDPLDYTSISKSVRRSKMLATISLASAIAQGLVIAPLRATTIERTITMPRMAVDDFDAKVPQQKEHQRTRTKKRICSKSASAAEGRLWSV